MAEKKKPKMKKEGKHEKKEMKMEEKKMASCGAK